MNAAAILIGVSLTIIFVLLIVGAVSTRRRDEREDIEHWGR